MENYVVVADSYYQAVLAGQENKTDYVFRQNVKGLIANDYEVASYQTFLLDIVLVEKTDDGNSLANKEANKVYVLGIATIAQVVEVVASSTY